MDEETVPRPARGSLHGFQFTSGHQVNRGGAVDRRSGAYECNGLDELAGRPAVGCATFHSDNGRVLVMDQRE